jgi:hypothetical protein
MRRNLGVLAVAVACAWPVTAFGQIVESVGTRALGMGGAFVAVADDSSAVWWNPGSLAAGPFVDVSISGGVTSQAPHATTPSNPAWLLSLSTPPVGLSFQRVRSTQPAGMNSIAGAPAGRQDGLTGIVTRTIDASALGVTLVQTIVDGVHIGGTVKYIRGRLLSGGTAGVSPEASEGPVRHRADVDLGVLGVVRSMRFGAVVRNLTEPSFDAAVRGEDRLRLPRQFRVGAAYAPVDGPPLVAAVDADVVAYASASGDRRVVALGAEWWWWKRRLGLRGGGRFNQIGARERSATGGVSMALWPGAYVEGHVARGGTLDERQWGLGARMTF